MIRMHRSFVGGITKLVYHVYPYRDSPTSKWPGYHNFGQAGFSNAWGPRAPHCKGMGDIDGDGQIDLLAASSTDNTEGLFWYRYPDWLKFNIAPGSFTTNMQIGDVDGHPGADQGGQGAYRQIGRRLSRLFTPGYRGG